MIKRKLYRKHCKEIHEAVKENIEEWFDLDAGPFNTDPLLEPRLDYLSTNPNASVLFSEQSEGKRFLFIVYVFAATIGCKKYKDNGPDEAFTTEEFTGGVTVELPINFEVDVETGESIITDMSSFAYYKWQNWPMEHNGISATS